MKNKLLLILLLCFTISLVSCCNYSWMYAKSVPLTEPIPPAESLSNLKYNEAWFGVILNGKKKVGLNHYKIEKVKDYPEIYKISSEAFLKFSLLGMKEEINLKETEFVNPDLSLISFSGEQRIGDKKLLLKGEVKNNELLVEITDENIVHSQKFKLKETVYSSVAPDIYPVIKGLKTGEVYKYQIYALETQSIQSIKQKILSYEKSELYQGTAFKVRTSTGFLSIDSWISRDGELLLQMDRGGLLIFIKEDEVSAKKFIYEESFVKDDILLDYSLVKTDKAIINPRNIKTLHLKLVGMDEDNDVISDDIQKASRVIENGVSKVEYLVTSPSLNNEKSINLPLKDPSLSKYLKPSLHIQSYHQEIINKSKEILGNEEGSLLAVKILTQWVSNEIADELVDSFSSLEVLRSKKGECQSHTYLYAALARASGIPTKVVSGIVYVEGKGFLHHTWAESYAGYWIAVDPTFDQIPVDATHIKFVEGENFDDLSPLVNIIGRIRAEVVEYK